MLAGIRQCSRTLDQSRTYRVSFASRQSNSPCDASLFERPHGCRQHCCLILLQWQRGAASLAEVRGAPLSRIVPTDASARAASNCVLLFTIAVIDAA